MTEPTDKELDAVLTELFGSDCMHEQWLREIGRPCARAVLAKWGTPPAVAGNHPYAIQWDAELGRTAMRFVDRAGDVHPGIDDAETICAEFHAAMSAVIERMPHVQRMSPAPQPTQAQAGAVPLPSVELMRLVMDVEQRHNFLRGTTNWAVAVGRAVEAAHGIGIKGGQHGAE